VTRFTRQANAERVIVTGSSAGGLATYILADHVASRMPPKSVTRAVMEVSNAVLTLAAHTHCVRCQVGFFLDHENIADVNVYPDEMAYVVRMQNVTATALSPKCLAAVGPSNEYKCFMAPHLQTFIRTPFFVLNSRYDQWQLDFILEANCILDYTLCSAAEQQAIVQCVLASRHAPPQH
jgi:hypothetical protein